MTSESSRISSPSPIKESAMRRIKEIRTSSMMDAINILGGGLLKPDRSTSRANLYSQIERVKDALLNETQGVKHKASLVDQEKVCKSDADHSCSISQEDSEDDESVSMYKLGASLGITLDGKPARSSRQVINYEKSKISFSANVEQYVRTRISDLLSVREVDVQPKYLGLPSVITRSKKVVFQAILDKIKKKLGGWKEKTLSIGGKEVLIKAVAQAMPMSLLAKQVWRMITNPTTLAAKLLKARYFPRSTYFDANVGYRPSYIWRSLISVKEIVCKGYKWNIRDGRHVNVWEDYWLKDHRSISNKITACFVSRSRPDTLYWHNGLGGQFSCKSAYYIALETFEDIMENLPEETNTLLRAIWKAKVHIKVKLFVWRVWKNYVPTIDNLQARGLNLASVSCTHCRHIGEDVIHVLFKCPQSKEVWDRCSFGKFYDTVGAITFDDFCHVILNKRKGHESGSFSKITTKRMIVDFPHQMKLFRWAKPQGDYIKINCDASWIKESGKAGLGFVARNESGDVLLSGAQVECFASSPLEAEAKSILWATNHGNNKGYLKIIFESDSMCLVNALKKGLSFHKLQVYLRRLHVILYLFSYVVGLLLKERGTRLLIV
ncbi:reverse transcriptase [Tanacetum coccineum]